MHEHSEQHADFIRGAVKDMGVSEVVYVSENTYDGGYEVRVGSLSFFIDYEAAEARDTGYIRERMKGYDA